MVLTQSKLKKIIRKEIRESKIFLEVRTPTLLGTGDGGSSNNKSPAYESVRDIIERFESQGFPKLGFVLNQELLDIVEYEIEKLPQYKYALEAIKELSSDKHSLISNATRYDYNDKTGTIRKGSELEKQYNNIKSEIKQKHELLGSIVSQNQTIRSKIQEFESIKNGEEPAIKNFMNSLANSQQYQGVQLKLNAIFELQDKGRIDSESVKALVTKLKNKKLVERKILLKKFIKLLLEEQIPNKVIR